MENSFFFIGALLIYFLVDKALDVFKERSVKKNDKLSISDISSIIILIATPIIKRLKNDKNKTTNDILAETYVAVIKMIDIERYKESLGLTDEGLKTFISSIILELYNQTK
jgi:hypothetical protein